MLHGSYNTHKYNQYLHNDKPGLNPPGIATAESVPIQKLQSKTNKADAE